MRTYCSLIVSSDTDSQIQSTVHRVLGLSGGEFIDTKTPEMIDRRLRLAKKMGFDAPAPPHYFWLLTSKHSVCDPNIHVHVSWLLDQVASGRFLSEISKEECRAYLACFWAGNGRGGGPMFRADILKKIASHGIEMHFDFYSDEAEVVGHVQMH